MKTCRKNNTECPFYPYKPLYNNRMYHYSISLNTTTRYNYKIYELGTTTIVGVFSKKEFEKLFIDIQVERKLKLEKLCK